MQIYSRKQRWKSLVFVGAVVIGIGTFWYTNNLVHKLEKEEKQKIEIWDKATELLPTADTEEQLDISLFFLQIIQQNETIPLITLDENGTIVSARNIVLYNAENDLIDGTVLKSLSLRSQRHLQRQLAVMKRQHEPIEIETPDAVQYLYYRDSFLLTRIQYFPLVQLGIVFLFIVLAYLIFSSSRRAEQNQVWVGMSKETAHQLGTPISSLMAWVELMKMKDTNPEVIREVEKDVRRLETIAERFSKIGSAPVLIPENLLSILESSVNYLIGRTSDKVVFDLHFGDLDELYAPLNITLFEWVIENICRNAIDAMGGTGTIDISVKDQNQVVYIDIADSGKGLPKSNYQVIFQPGYTTKPRGWGLGLSLVKRIVENYHAGKVFVKSSELNKGTTFRIVLNK